jgi:hypothetical protein
MKSIVLIFDKEPILKFIAADYHRVGVLELQTDERMVITCRNGYFIFNIDPHAIEEFDASELEIIHASIRSPRFVHLEFTDENTVELALSELRPQGLVLVDNDHGLISSLIEIKRRIETNENWLTAPC